MSTNFVHPPLAQLSKDQYEDWWIKIKALLGFQDLWDTISGGFEKPSDEVKASYTQAQKDELKKIMKKDQSHCFLIFAGLHRQTLVNISNATTSKDVWDNFTTIFKGVMKVKKIPLQAL